MIAHIANSTSENRPTAMRTDLQEISGQALQEEPEPECNAKGFCRPFLVTPIV
jgi:hypothetical protein